MRLGELLRARERGAKRPTMPHEPDGLQLGQVIAVPIESVRPNPFQPRRTFDRASIEELARSIAERGLLQPIVVRPAEGGYELLVGERRLRACQHLGLSHVDAIVRSADDEEAAVVALIENVQREDLALFDEVEALRQLVEEFGISQQDLAKALGKSQSTIANKLRLLKLDVRVRELVAEAGLTERHARALLAFEDGEEQLEAAQYIIRHGLNVRQTDEWIARRLEAQETPKRRQTIRGVYKDARLFINSVKTLVQQLAEAGVGVDLSEEATEEYLEVRVRIRTGRGAD